MPHRGLVSGERERRAVKKARDWWRTLHSWDLALGSVQNELSVNGYKGKAYMLLEAVRVGMQGTMRKLEEKYGGKTK